jgi:hypothetical protein
MTYKHRSTTPDWMYHQANLDTDQFPIIQKELLKLFLITKKENIVPYTSTFVEIGDKELMRNTCTTLMDELRRLNLYDNFFVISFISVESTREFPPHVDSGVDIALNIPLINCEGTYTVWYDGKLKDQGLPSYAIGSAIAEISRVADPRTVTEIGRCDSSIPHWINVNMFHRPETHHNQFRVAASVRFDPEPVDEKGKLWPHLIK